MVRVNASDIETFRDLAKSIKKSGMTIEQYADGHRIANILKILRIQDKQINNNIENSKGYNYYEFTSFIKEIYLNCKVHDFPPSQHSLGLKICLTVIFLIMIMILYLLNRN